MTYAADVWTSASVDIRASASLPVSEQRDELDLGLSHELGDLKLSGGYRFSTEHDYVSHGLDMGASLDLAEHNSTLGLVAYAFDDTVGRAGAPKFARGLVTVGARASFTQVLGQATLGQLAYEVGHLDGYQSSPYRFVGIGGTGFGCEGAVRCYPEHEPNQRSRQALAATLRHGLSNSVSVGATYRVYSDSWALVSHTLSAQVGWLVETDTMLSLRYRYYWQSGASFYRRVYQDVSGYTTRDREQSPMLDHRLGADVEQRVPIDDGGTSLVLRLSVAGDLYAYADFAGLSQVRALELSLAISLER